VQRILPQSLIDDSKPPLSGMALASLLLSFLSLILPFGIAALVLGHVSRHQILKSRGRLRGKSLSFAGLILAYIQVPISISLFLGGIGLLYQFNQELDRHPYDRAALALLLKNGSLERPSVQKQIAANPLYRQHMAIAALRLIRARQSDYLTVHPNEGYACRLEQIGEPLNPENELGALIAGSHYYVRVSQCQIYPQQLYAVMASPKGDFDSDPTFCIDSTNAFYKYSPAESKNVLREAIANPQLCPRGERVEP
jgi:Domain of unknown function (DUF4190)